MPHLSDTLGRKINYLRLSVTDRCDMRCFYCMPGEGVRKLAHEAVLSFEELFQITESAVTLGIEKIRITGGEPLIRKGIVPFLSRLSALPSLRHLVLTTNGSLLADMAHDLRAAGVQRLNVSLDSLNRETFAAVTRGGDLGKVLSGLDRAEQCGFPAPKLNIVVMKGINDGELLDFVELARNRGNSVRFIEYMPVVKDEGWQKHFLPGDEILKRIAQRYTMREIDKGPCAGPSRDFRIPGVAGSIGIISAISGHFCSDCNRIRVTSTGQAKGCLFSDEKVDLLPYLRPRRDRELLHVLEGIVKSKPERHAMSEEGYQHQNFAMAQVGG